MVSIIIDTREQRLYERMKDSSYTIEQKALDIGDIHLVHEGVCVILERKTFADFAASLKDGRYKEQKYRLKESGLRVAYLLEEVPSVPDLVSHTHTIYGLQPSAFITSMIHTMFRDGFPILMASSMDETVQWIYEIAKRMEKEPNNFRSIQEGGSYVDTLRSKQCKSEKIDVPMCQTMMLMQIPGISHKLAKELVDKFGTVRALIETLVPLDDKARLTELQSVPLLGPKKAQKIIEYLI